MRNPLNSIINQCTIMQALLHNQRELRKKIAVNIDVDLDNEM